jgi:hypothetical protein
MLADMQFRRDQRRDCCPCQTRWVPDHFLDINDLEAQRENPSTTIASYRDELPPAVDSLDGLAPSVGAR